MRFLVYGEKRLASMAGDRGELSLIAGPSPARPSSCVCDPGGDAKGPGDSGPELIHHGPGVFHRDVHVDVGPRALNGVEHQREDIEVPRVVTAQALPAAVPPGEGELLTGGPPDDDEHRAGFDLCQHLCQGAPAVPQQVPHVPHDALEAGTALSAAVRPVLRHRDREVILRLCEPAAGEPVLAAQRSEELDHRQHGGANSVEQGQ